MDKIPHTIVETESFLASTDKLWTEDERAVFKLHIGLNVFDGDLMPGAGGIRKIRWSRSGIGKRGGVRVIYYYYNENSPLYLLFAYAKGTQDDLTVEERKALREVAEVLKKQIINGKGGERSWIKK